MNFSYIMMSKVFICLSTLFSFFILYGGSFNFFVTTVVSAHEKGSRHGIGKNPNKDMGNSKNKPIKKVKPVSYTMVQFDIDVRNTASFIANPKNIRLQRQVMNSFKKPNLKKNFSQKNNI